MARDYRAVEASQKILLKHILRLGRGAHIAHILGMLGMEVAALDPALAHTHFLQAARHCLLGVDHYALRIGDAAAQQNAGLPLADTVLDAVARIYHQAAGVLHLLEQLGGAALAAHVDNHILLHRPGHELLLGVYAHLAAAFAQLLGHGVENRGVVAYVVGRISAGAHHRRDFSLSHTGRV